ncbi:MAG: thioredoxin family protein [Phycisphaerales bacterium]|nr:MAG: thioredoxin family protein [Phycisphaerales bacterium]
MYSRVFTIAGVLLIGAAALYGAEEPAKPKREPIYQVDGRGTQRVKAALVRAGADNKRVLLMVGGNWCGWCYKLHDVFQQDGTVASLIRSEYDLVMIDSQADKDVIAKWKIQPQGYPYLAVVDATGKKLTEQETGSLEIGSKHDPRRVAAFLERWRAQPLEASEVFAAALKQARTQEKNIFIRIGAPWCGWCRRMDKFLAQPPIAKIVEKDYVVVKIDQQRMTNAKAVIDKIRKPSEGGGIPWFAFLDAKGNILVTSTRPDGRNVGFPVDRQTEIPHFVNMLKQTRSKITDADIELLVKALVAADPRRRTETQRSR